MSTLRRTRLIRRAGAAGAGNELRIELKGNLAAILSAAQYEEVAREPASDLSLQIAMVAGARNQHYLQLWRPAA